MTFTAPLATTFDKTNFQNITIDSTAYSMDMFKQSIQVISPNIYRIVLEPTGYIFLEKTVFIVTTKN